MQHFFHLIDVYLPIVLLVKVTPLMKSPSNTIALLRPAFLAVIMYGETCVYRHVGDR